MTLIINYRPTTFTGVIGQGPITRALQVILAKRSSQTFLFSGPSGTGKSTLVGLCTAALNCPPASVRRIIGTSQSGVDSMRELEAALQYKAFGKNPTRAIVVDEAHGLSKQAWDVLLDATEHPPKHIYWFFCTTNPSKVPATIKTRCTSFALRPVAEHLIEELLIDVMKHEKIELDEATVGMLAKQAAGSPRQALSFLDACRSAKTRKEAARLIETVLESDFTIELCRHLVARGSWMKAMAIVADVQPNDCEGIRIIVCNYVAKVLQNAGEAKAGALLSILDAFSVPYNSAEGLAPLYLSIGRVLLSDE